MQSQPLAIIYQRPAHGEWHVTERQGAAQALFLLRRSFGFELPVVTQGLG